MSSIKIKKILAFGVNRCGACIPIVKVAFEWWGDHDDVFFGYRIADQLKRNNELYYLVEFWLSKELDDNDGLVVLFLEDGSTELFTSIDLLRERLGVIDASSESMG